MAAAECSLTLDSAAAMPSISLFDTGQRGHLLGTDQLSNIFWKVDTMFGGARPVTLANGVPGQR